MESYAVSTYESPSAIKRWLHKQRFCDAIKILNPQKSDVILDYGCGDGYLLRVVHESGIAQEQLFGYEPAQEMFNQAKVQLNSGIALFSSLNQIKDQKFTKVICMDTCEHLHEPELNILLNSIRNLLDDNGKVIFSVPIEIGIPAIFKNTFRFIKDRHYDNLTVNNYVKTALTLKVSRKDAQVDSFWILYRVQSVPVPDWRMSCS